MRRALPFLIALVLLTWGGSANAADGTTTEKREAAEDALATAQRLSDGRGIHTGRELTPALIELARRRSALTRADRAEANSLLGRPTDPDDKLQTGGPYTTDDVQECTTNFCVHWVETTDDAPDLTDGADPDSIPDYVNKVMDAAEVSYTTEVVNLGWQPPLSDGDLGGGDGLTDIYVKELNPGDDKGLYGYATTDPQTTRSQYGFLVVDDDYSSEDFPRYGGNPDKPLQVTLAHEFNHVLQFGYDMAQDNWMYESTATWAEEKVFPDVDDYSAIYLPGWIHLPRQPITESANGKEYGSAVWNLWLEGQFGGPDVIRDAWAGSSTPANTVQGGGFAPKAYDAAIRDHAGPGFSAALGDFSAATATWEVPGPDFEEGDEYGDVDREVAPLAPDGSLQSTTLDHTGFTLYDVPIPASSVERLDLGVALPDGTAGSFALVGDDGVALTRDSEDLPSGGGGTVSLPDPASFTRITAVLANTNVQHTGYDFDCEDWDWSRDEQTVRFQLSSHAAADPAEAAPPVPAATTTTTDCTPETPPTTTPTPSPSPTPTPSVTPPPPPPPLATSVRLSRNTTRIGTAARKGVLSLFARTNKAGRLAARGSVDTATAKRLKVGRRTTTAGTGRRTALAPGRFKINVKLTRKVRAALKREKTRTLRIKVQVTFVPADGTRAVRRTLSVLLRP